jgi:predicted lactoylglutathione lyase
MALGFTFNAQFSSDENICMIIGENMYAMFLNHERFQGFTSKEIIDASKSTEVLLSLQLESREEVRSFVEKAITAGGKATFDFEDHGYMLEGSFECPDHHNWGVFYMDPSHIQE